MGISFGYPFADKHNSDVTGQVRLMLSQLLLKASYYTKLKLWMSAISTSVIYGFWNGLSLAALFRHYRWHSGLLIVRELRWNFFNFRSRCTSRVRFMFAKAVFRTGDGTKSLNSPNLSFAFVNFLLKLRSGFCNNFLKSLKPFSNFSAFCRWLPNLEATWVCF